jgi:hypothetical protein
MAMRNPYGAARVPLLRPAENEHGLGAPQDPVRLLPLTVAVQVVLKVSVFPVMEPGP